MVKLVLASSLLVGIALTATAASARSSITLQTKKADPSKDVYVSNCQICHGPDGVSQIKDMSFVGRKWKTTTDAEAVKIITKGSPGTVMLPFESKLKKEQIAALARYVRALDSPEARKKK